MSPKPILVKAIYLLIILTGFGAAVVLWSRDTLSSYLKVYLQNANNYEETLSHFDNPKNLLQPPRPPIVTGTSGRLHYDPSSSTRDCVISRTPGQSILFEQSLEDFKQRYQEMPILILIPIADSAKLVADMTSQLIQTVNYFGESRILVSFAVGGSKDDTYSQVVETCQALHLSKILHRMQYTDDLESWTERALFGYMADFELAVVVRGVICANDLVRLIIQAVDNDADMACAVDVSFDKNHRILSNNANLDTSSETRISAQTLLHSTRPIQAGCCDGSVKVIRLRSIRPTRILPYECEEFIKVTSQSSIVRPKRLRPGNDRPLKIMISPSVKSSPDPDDFRTAMQLGFMDLQGYDHRPLVWEDNRRRS